MNERDLIPDNDEVIQELTEILEEPIMDDAEYLLKQVYETLGLDVPSFLEPVDVLD